MADTKGVNRTLASHFPLRSIVGLLACGLWLAGLSGCSSAPKTPRLASHWREAEIAVSNRTIHPWRIALRSTAGEEVKTVEIRPRESLAIVVPGGDYTIEQTLFAPEPAGTSTRRFSGRLESGGRYNWTLATLLSLEESVAP